MASTKQVETLVKMCQERGLDTNPIFTESADGRLTNHRVDELFKILKTKPRVTESAPKVTDVPPQTGTQVTPAVCYFKPKPKVAATEGFYLKDGQVYKVAFNRAKTRTYARRLVVELGKPHWHYAEGLVFELNESHRVTPQAAKQYGDLHHYCLCCGRELTKPVSVDRGVGPVCWGRLGF